jgi:hypothetical protein
VSSIEGGDISYRGGMNSHVRILLELRAMDRRFDTSDVRDREVWCSCPQHDPQTDHGPSLEGQQLGVFQHVSSPGPAQT